MSPTFAQLGLPDALVDSIAASGVVVPFPVQAATIPDALAGRDVSGKAPTGSGKTLAFGLPLLARSRIAGPKRPRGLVLAPTRELAEQIKRELVPLARSVDRRVLSVYGGVSYGSQKSALNRGVDVLVATPGRLEDLIAQRAVDLGDVEIAVIDEADRMADMGFLPAVRRILDGTSRHRQTLMFSATLDGAVAVLSREYQRDPVRHESGPAESRAAEVRHHFWKVQSDERVRHTAAIVDALGRSIVFTRTRRGADRLAKQLDSLGLSVAAIHGGRSQAQRDRALRAFTLGGVHALVATDVAARGVHVDAVESVIHFDPPADHTDYVHRSGRTARAGATGTVVSLVTADQVAAVRAIQRKLGVHQPIGEPHPGSLVRRADHRGAPSRGGRIRDDRSTAQTPRPPRQPLRHRNGSHSVYVANLPWRATARDVEGLFAPFGDVHRTTLITDRTGRSKGFAFVDLTHEAGSAAIEALHGSTMGGRDLVVSRARPRRQAR